MRKRITSLFLVLALCLSLLPTAAFAEDTDGMGDSVVQEQEQAPEQETAQNNAENPNESEKPAVSQNGEDSDDAVTGSCEHEWSNGVCTKCQEVCTHGKVTEQDGKYICDTCGTQMVARDDNYGTYYADIADAVNSAADADDTESYIKLLTNASTDKAMRITASGRKRKAVVLYLNGHNLDRSDIRIGGINPGKADDDPAFGAELGFKDNGSVDANITVAFGGNLSLTNWEGGTFGTVTVEAGGTFGSPDYEYGGTIQKLLLKCRDRDIGLSLIKISGGTYGEIINNTGSPITLSSMLGNYCAFYDKDGKPMSRTTQIENGESLSNVTVNECTAHADGDNDQKCDYCNTTVTASVTTNGGETAYYETLSDAFEAASYGDVITLLKNVDLGDDLIDTTLLAAEELDLNGKTLKGSGSKGCVLQLSGSFTIHDTSSAQTGGITADSGSAVYVTDSSKLTVKSGNFSRVYFDGYSSAEISGGTFGSISTVSIGQPIGSLLADGHAFQDSEGNLVNGYTATSAENVTVVAHSKHDFDSDGVCACGVSCTHAEMDAATGKCLECGKFLAIASATVGDVTTYYTDLQAAIDNAANGTVKLLQKIELAEAVTFNNEKSNNVTLDMNGYSLTTSAVTVLTVSRDMTICGERGTIYSSYSGQETVNSVVLTGGHLTIKGYGFNALGGKGERRALYATGGSLTVEDGSFGVDVIIESGCAVEIKNGTFWKNVSIASPNAKISGGEFKAGGAVSVNGAGAVISGGTFYDVSISGAGAEIIGGTFGDTVTIKNSSKAISSGSFGYELINQSGTVEDLLADGYAFKHGSDYGITDWLTESELAGGSVFCVDAVTAPITSVSLTANQTTVKYGEASGVTLTAECTADGEGAVTQEWYLDNELIDTTASTSYTLPEDSPAGTHTYRVVFTKDGYSKSAEITITVQAIDLSNAEVTVGSLTYNGTEQTPTVTVKMGETPLTAGTDYTVTVDKQTNAGTYTLTVTGTGNYTNKIENVAWKIEPKTVDNLSINVAPCTYNGLAQEPPVELKSGDTVIPEDAYTVEYSNNTNAGTATVTVKAKDDGNYKFDPQEEKFTIAKADAPAMQPVELTVINGVANSYLFDFPELPELSNTCEYGSVRYEMSSVALTGGYASSAAAITAENKFQLTVPQVDSEGESSVGTVTVKITTDNYQDITLTFNVTAKNKLTPVVDGTVSASAITYGDALSKSAISGKMINPDTKEEVNGTFAWKDGTIKPKADNGEYRSTTAEWTFTPTGANAYQYAETTGEVRVVVNKAEFTNVSVEQVGTLTYNGQPQTATLKKAVTAVDNGETIRFGYSAGPWEVGLGYDTSVPAFTEAGKHTVYYVVYDLDSNHKSVEGQFTVTIEPKKVTDPTIIVDGAPFTYTGEEIKPTVTVKDGDTVIDPKEYQVSYRGNTNAGTATVTITDKEGGNYVVSGSATFEIVKADVEMTDAQKTVTQEVINDLEYTYTIDLPKLPTLDGSKTYGDIAYSLPAVQMDAGYYTVGKAKIENGKLILSIDKNPVTTTGQIGTVKVTVSSTNYKDVTFTVNLNAVNKPQPHMIVSVATDVVYGMTLDDIKLEAKATDPTTGKEISGTIAWDNDLAIVPEVNDKREFRWTFTPDDTEHYRAVTNPISFYVAPATLIGQPTFEKIAQSGKMLADAALTANESWPKGTLQWVDKDGKKLEDTTEVKANTAYQWKFTPDSNNYNTVEGSIMLYSVSTGGGGSSSGSSSANAISTSGKSDNGSISTDKSTAKKGDTVTITVTPNTGYKLDKLTVTDAKGNTLTVSDKGNGKYTFTMPDSKVTVTPTFVQETTQPEQPDKTRFVDVADNAWYAESVYYAADKGMMTGVGENKFAPTATTTRGMLMTILARYAGQDTTGSSPWYQKGMEWAKAKGVSDGTNPTGNITREQLVTMLYRYAGSPAASGSLNGFTDASTVSSYAVNAMQWATTNGIVNGANNKLNPQGNATRAEMAAILMRFSEKNK